MNEINNTLKSAEKQARELIEDITKISGQELLESAKRFGVIEREREIKDVKCLLILAFVYVTSNASFRIIAALASVIDATCSASDEAWRTKFLKCEAWLIFLLEQLMLNSIPTILAFYYNGSYMGVYLIDASTIKQVGKKGKELRLHMCYNFTKGVMEEVVITDKHTAESTMSFTIKPLSIYIADAGYGKGKELKHIVSKGGNALFRATPNHLKLAKDSKGKNIIDMAKRLKTKKNLVKIKCYVQTEKNKYFPVWIIASRLPEDKALLARERKIRSSNKKQSKIKDSTLIYSEWVVLMTNMDPRHNTESLLKLYRSRWQIELLFKRIKQSFNIKRVKKASLKHTKIVILLQLIIWASAELKTLEAEIKLMEENEEYDRYSLWVYSTFYLLKLKAKIGAFLSFCFDSGYDSKEIFKRLRNHKSKRINQYALFRMEFCNGMSSADLERLRSVA